MQQMPMKIVRNRSFKKTMKTEEEPPKTATIPDEVICDQILPRLPVKPLIRFKSVCKNWYSLISSPQFAKSHLHYSSSSPYFVISKSRDMRLAMVGVDKDGHNLKQVIQLDRPWGLNIRDLEVVGCCNGLVCLNMEVVDGKSGTNTEELFAVWNPAIHQFRKISAPFDNWTYKHGFGCALALDDYKILATESTRLWIFSLGMGGWKQIDFPSDHYFFSFKGYRNGVLLNDTLYWNAPEMEEQDWNVLERKEDTVRIFSFNLVDEQFRDHMPLMIPGSRNYLGHSDLFVLKGCLSLITRRHCGAPDVVILKQGGDCLDSWEKMFSFPFMHEVYYFGFSHSGKCLAHDTFDSPWQLMLVGPNLEDFLKEGVVLDRDMDSAHLHVESLISPFGTVRV